MKIPPEERREDQTGADLASQLEELKEKLAKAEDGKLKMEHEREHYKTEVEQLRGDLEVTHNESAKEGKKKSEKVCCCNDVLMSLLKAWAECYYCSL